MRGVLLCHLPIRNILIGSARISLSIHIFYIHYYDTTFNNFVIQQYIQFVFLKQSYAIIHLGCLSVRQFVRQTSCFYEISLYNLFGWSVFCSCNKRHIQTFKVLGFLYIYDIFLYHHQALSFFITTEHLLYNLFCLIVHL